ncbi:MAG: DNA/RNA non-specific endonuclease [Bryobacteraceae bacterium]
MRLATLLLSLGSLLAQENLKFGNPGCVGDDRELADRRFFVLCHSADLKVPLWVSYELKREDLDGPAPRAKGFRPDTELARPGSTDADYRNSGFSRGHMAPAEDFDRSTEAMRATFTLSNIVPQLQGVNGGRWAQLEASGRAIAAEHGAAYIVTGPIFARALVDTIGDGEVGIPTHTFKVVLAVGSGGARKMFASIMPNAENVTKPVNAYSTTVRNVERRTGFNFFSALPDAEERALEMKKENFPQQPPKKNSKKKKKPA